MHCFIGRGVWPAPLSSHLLALNHLPAKVPQGSKPDGNVRFPPGTLLLLEVSFAFPHGQRSASRVQHLLEGPAAIEAIRGRHGFTFATTPLELPEGPWPRAASSTTDRQCVRAFDPESISARVLLNQGQWTAQAGTGDISATAPGLLPFVVHEAKCVQPQQCDPAARQRAREACNAASWGLVGHFLDPALLKMLARTAHSLSAEPFHASRWREATMHNFTVYVHHVMRVGHLASPIIWRSLLYPSPARLSLAWDVTQLPLSMPHDLPSPAMVASSKWLVRALLTLQAESPLALPDLPGLEEAPPSGSQSSGWLPSCPNEVPEQLADWLAAHALSASRDLHLLSLAVGVLLSLLTHKTELIVRGVYGAGKTQCIALLAAFFALRGHQVYYASRENTTIVAMALSYRSCSLGPLMMRGPKLSGSCPTHKRARVKVRILMLVTLTKISRSGMPS